MSFQRPDYIEQLRAEASGRPFRPAKKAKRMPPPNPEEAHRLFHVCTGNRWMDLGDREPPPKMLFGEFWHQGELCILFADTNVGKSILAVQIANSISRHSPIRPFALQTGPAKVLYIDFELTTSQFTVRYRGEKGNYTFSDKFFRADFDHRAAMPDSFNTYDEFVVAGIEYKLMLVQPAVLVIDNITCLRGGTENASVALSLMQRLKTLKAGYKLSVLVLAHTPKRRNPHRPLSADDLQGSKLLINFADSAFAIGRSSVKKGWCYLKQIKQRSTTQVYGEDNVCLCRLWRVNGFLRFGFKGTGNEHDHLLPHAVYKRRQLPAKVISLAAEGFSQRQIRKKLHISLGSVNKLVNG